MGSDCDDRRVRVGYSKVVELNCDDPGDETTSRITLVDTYSLTILETEWRKLRISECRILQF